MIFENNTDIMFDLFLVARQKEMWSFTLTSLFYLPPNKRCSSLIHSCVGSFHKYLCWSFFELWLGDMNLLSVYLFLFLYFLDFGGKIRFSLKMVSDFKVCKDKNVASCKKHKDLCRHPKYMNVMIDQCPRTCKYCYLLSYNPASYKNKLPPSKKPKSSK